jgi:hypothetical protein
VVGLIAWGEAAKSGLQIACNAESNSTEFTSMGFTSMGFKSMEFRL